MPTPTSSGPPAATIHPPQRPPGIRHRPALDFIEAFETYSKLGDLKGGEFGPTAKRWRPKIKAFCTWLGHRDLARVTSDDGIRWMDHLIAEKFAAKSVRDVWLASIKATAGFMVERRQLKVNPFAGVRVRGVRSTKESNQKGFSDAQAKAILTATLATPSHLISVEMQAGRRWVPWICAYTGARVNEITSLRPSDIRRDPETRIWCLYLRPEVTKGAYERVIPIHSHLIAQTFLDYVEKRRKAKLPLFYHPGRARGGTNANRSGRKSENGSASGCASHCASPVFHQTTHGDTGSNPSRDTSTCTRTSSHSSRATAALTAKTSARRSVSSTAISG